CVHTAVAAKAPPTGPELAWILLERPWPRSARLGDSPDTFCTPFSRSRPLLQVRGVLGSVGGALAAIGAARCFADCCVHTASPPRRLLQGRSWPGFVGAALAAI